MSGTYDVGAKHKMHSAVIDAEGEVEFWVTDCWCEFARDHYGFDSEARAVDA
ncbi:hypothetical protein [Curtobacterium sp. MCSS17_006]|jgi:hypothetical protein|uniref:hypothetical protein n=1 Tax=Curtobacterium sp. MCSS17_006 TaxID=2175642 RepID=UPI0015E88DAD|nr:hypothetical protein [Curtobacterium sp. MCSS17_006]